LKGVTGVRLTQWCLYLWRRQDTECWETKIGVSLHPNRSIFSEGKSECWRRI